MHTVPHVNANVYVYYAYSPDIPVSSVDCTIYTPGIEPNPSLQCIFLVPPGTHHCWVGRGSIEWKVCLLLLLDMTSSGNRAPDFFLSVDCTIYTLGIEPNSFTVSFLLEEISAFAHFCCSYSPSLQCSFLVPPGTHHCWVGRCSMAWRNEKFAWHFY